MNVTDEMVSAARAACSVDRITNGEIIDQIAGPRYGDKLIRGIIEAAIALMRGQSWQPIGTAPKDGVTEILAYDGRFGSTFIVVRPIDCPDDAACTDSGIACYPTHWQSLPAPPQQEPAE